MLLYSFVYIKCAHFLYRSFVLLEFLIYLHQFFPSSVKDLKRSNCLPEAVAAPTSVMCLVHSRTLVTAGVVLTDCYVYVFLNSDVASFAVVFSELCSLVEMDVKKIVALTTTPQIGVRKRKEMISVIFII